MFLNMAKIYKYISQLDRSEGSEQVVRLYAAFLNVSQGNHSYS